MGTYTTKAPIQTPAVFVKAGGMAVFSTACENALLKAGYDPDTFGSYEHTKSQIDKAKAKVAAYDNHKPGDGEKPPEPLPHERHLAKCQSGHLSQDATHRGPGGRNNNCKNLNDGYDTDRAPCMPQSGGAWDPPGSEHNVASRHEVASAKVAQESPPKPPASAYDPKLRDQHEDHRTELVVEARKKSREKGDLEIDRATWEANRAGEAREDSTASGGGGSGDVGKPPQVDGPVVQVDAKDESAPTAAECINAFRRAGMAQMQSELQAQRAHAVKNEAAAVQTPKGLDKLKTGAEKAKEDSTAKNRKLGQKKAEMTRKEKAIRENAEARGRDLTDHEKKRIAAYDEKKKKIDEVQEGNRKKAAAAQSRYDKAAEAPCKAAEGERSLKPGHVPGQQRATTKDPPDGTGPARAPGRNPYVPTDQKEQIFGTDGDAEQWNDALQPKPEGNP